MTHKPESVRGKKVKAVTREHLEALMTMHKNTTPSAPDWYPTIDLVVGVLLQIEIDRRTAHIKRKRK